ncbi:unnamed protein product [Ceratitis capitata]|uniref:(Mediterranean fruit fly) hypothetical protein n=1 Tax=Ceratitis capitata TaxID=7213 RepID=A0A811V9J6_CERCA|nr:unnamed protein product [Ceratitis capitata]
MSGYHWHAACGRHLWHELVAASRRIFDNVVAQTVMWYANYARACRLACGSGWSASAPASAHASGMRHMASGQRLAAAAAAVVVKSVVSVAVVNTTYRRLIIARVMLINQ